MTREQRDLEERFEAAVKGVFPVSLAKPFMREREPGYDSPFTNHMFKGYARGIAEGKRHRDALERIVELMKRAEESSISRYYEIMSEVEDIAKEALK